ncbi:syntaxin-binding protein 6 isoform X2 [Manis javanica]|uniref:syntaxin-binding protein 6 isoform X2 n=1 Tax=Manis javanica TaxID=9974 RepID=UPI003C6D3A78
MLRGGRGCRLAVQALALGSGQAAGARLQLELQRPELELPEFSPHPSLPARRSRSGRGSRERRRASTRAGRASSGARSPARGSPRRGLSLLRRVPRAGTAGTRTGSHVTNKKPTQASITKVKQFEGSTSFVRRSQWMLEQLRQVNGIDPNRDSAEFDLLFENAFDQWVASTASEKCTFFQILHHTCQRYLTDRKPEFINCQSKVTGGNSILHSAADSVTSAVQKASQALNERGERLGRAEEKTEDMKNSAQQFAETAHKLAMKHKC